MLVESDFAIGLRGQHPKIRLIVPLFSVYLML